jgi:hypothetical protein
VVRTSGHPRQPAHARDCAPRAVTANWNRPLAFSVTASSSCWSIFMEPPLWIACHPRSQTGPMMVTAFDGKLVLGRSPVHIVKRVPGMVLSQVC